MKARVNPEQIFPRLQQRDFFSGEVFLLDKPLHWTSFDAVGFLKRAIRQFRNTFPSETDEMHSLSKLKVGHAGTLDPLASGLLIICTGKETKNIEKYQAEEKEYTGTFFIGATTPCFDREKEIDHYFETRHITNELILETSRKFTGEILQSPPAHSAIWVEGKRAYEMARAGTELKLKERPITIHTFEITGIEMPLVHFRVVCSKGTYIRSLARDFGIALNSGAHLAALRRTRIGNFKVEDAIQLLGC